MFQAKHGATVKALRREYVGMCSKADKEDSGWNNEFTLSKPLLVIYKMLIIAPVLQSGCDE